MSTTGSKPIKHRIVVEQSVPSPDSFKREDARPGEDLVDTFMLRWQEPLLGVERVDVAHLQSGQRVWDDARQDMTLRGLSEQVSSTL